MIAATGFTYEAAIHCFDCTADRFGEPKDKVSAFYGEIDNEGNEVGAIFQDSEFDYAPHCDGCGVEIDAVNLGNDI